MPYDTFMRGRSKLAGLPPLTPHQEKPLYRALILARLPETGCIGIEDLAARVFEDLEMLGTNATGSYWAYHVSDGDEFLGMVQALVESGHCSRSGDLYRRERKASTFFKRLNAGAKLWVDRLQELTLLDTLAGI